MSGTDTIVADGWHTYVTAVLPAGASPVQLLETRRAFYAGALHLLDIVAAIGEDSTSEDAGVEMLEAAFRELRQFADDVKGGRA